MSDNCRPLSKATERLASGNAVWQAQIAEAHGDNYSLALALVAGVFAVAIAAVTFFGPERRGVEFTAPAARLD